ncbi:hypothetical protein Ocin01_03020, partial [Orchesella cincta]
VLSGIIEFCANELIYRVNTDVCPGGIRFLEQAILPDFNCVCFEGVLLAPGARYVVDGRISIPIHVSPQPSCREWIQGLFYDPYIEHNSPEEGCQEEPWKALEHWFMVPLADMTHPERDTLAMWRGVDDESMYNLQDFRLFTRDSSGNLYVPLERDFQGYLAYYKGLQNKSNDFNAKEIQIGQYCMTVGGVDNEDLVYMSKRSLRFDNTSIKYGCNRNSIKMIAVGIGSTEPMCGIYWSVDPPPILQVLRYEDILLQNNRPLPPQENIIHHFKNALKAEFSDILELRLKNFRNFEKQFPNHQTTAHCLEFLSKSFKVVQKLFDDEKQNRLLEDTLKVFIIGTGEQFWMKSSEHDCKELTRILNSCVEKSVPIILIDQKNCTKNSTSQTKGLKEKYYKNDLVVEVIRGALDLSGAQCLASLHDNDTDHDRFLRLYAKVLNKIYKSPLIHEKFWFLETVHVKVLLPGLSTGLLRKLKNLRDQVSKLLKPGVVFGSDLKWQRAEKLYQFKKRAMKPWNDEKKICDGFTIWGGAACCLQFDSQRHLVPNMTIFKEKLKNGPELCT